MAHPPSARQTITTAPMGKSYSLPTTTEGKHRVGHVSSRNVPPGFLLVAV